MTDQRQKRILICSTDYLPHIGGAELAVHEIAKRLSLQGYVFDLITSRLERGLPAYEFIGGVHVYRVGFGFWGDKFLLPILGLFRYASLMRRPYDAIWSLMASQGSVLASFVSLVSKAPLILTLQEGDEEEYLARYAFGSKFLFSIFIKPWYTLVFKKARRITVISEYLKKRARKYTNVPIDLVPNGVDVGHFSHIDIEVVEGIKDTYNLKNKKVIVSVSRLVQKNNIELLIKALSHLPEDVVLLLVGDGDKRESLLKLAEERGLDKRVIFVGKIPPKDVPSYIHAGDVFARVSLSEGFGSAFLEAFVAGVPVITSPVGGIVDIVRDGETGVFVSTDDERETAKAIERLLVDKNFESHIKNEARVVAQKYTWDAISDQMSNSFDRL